MRTEIAAGLTAVATPSMIILVPFSSSARGCSGREFLDSVHPSRRHRRAGREHLQNAPVAVSGNYGAGRRLLGSNDAPFMPHRQPAVQSLQDFHSRPGIAGAFPPWQQLQGMQLEPHRVVPGHFSAVLEAHDLVQAQLRAQSKCFTASKLIAPNLRASLSAACTSCLGEGFQQAEHLYILTLAPCVPSGTPADASACRTPRGGPIPAMERPGPGRPSSAPAAAGSGWVVDEIVSLIGAWVPGDNLGPAADDRLAHVCAHQHVALSVGNWDRAAVGPAPYQGVNSPGPPAFRRRRRAHQAGAAIHPCPAPSVDRWSPYVP